MLLRIMVIIIVIINISNSKIHIDNNVNCKILCFDSNLVLIQICLFPKKSFLKLWLKLFVLEVFSEILELYSTTKDHCMKMNCVQ